MTKFNPIQINVTVTPLDGSDSIRTLLTTLKEFEDEPKHPSLVELMELERLVNGAYRERNELVAVLSKLWPSYWAKDESADWDWQHVIFVDGPTGQLSWHVSDHDFVSCFGHLEEQPNQWDGHSTPEKYRRLAAIEGGE